LCDVSKVWDISERRMKVKEFIKALKKIDGEFEVYVADWNENYAAPIKLTPDEDKCLVLAMES
jgi:hypothetical protein